MKKIRFLLCLLCMSVLIGCSSKNDATEYIFFEEPPQPVEDTEDDSENTSIANPWTSIQKDVIEETLDAAIYIPEEAEDVNCTTLITEKLYQVDFKYLDIDFTYRLKKTGELEDISGTYYEWGDPLDDYVNSNPAKVYYCEEDENVYELALWYDEGKGLSHSLFAASDHDLDGFDIIAVAINLVSSTKIVNDDWIEDPDNYVKDATEEDVEFDEETGMQYVKNQLLISCNLNTPKEKGEEIAGEYDAEVVGYIAITSDFQIEFNTDKTYEELEKLAEEIENKYDYVSMVTPNSVMEVTVDT